MANLFIFNLACMGHITNDDFIYASLIGDVINDNFIYAVTLVHT